MKIFIKKIQPFQIQNAFKYGKYVCPIHDIYIYNIHLLDNEGVDFDGRYVFFREIYANSSIRIDDGIDSCILYDRFCIK